MNFPEIRGERPVRTVICEAPINIAVIKYWGKSNDDLIIPLNDSISVTLSTDHLRARTKIVLKPGTSDVTFSLNGVTEALNKRTLTAITLCKEEARLQASASEAEISAGIEIISSNNFPTAAGLASSAAGFACLVYALKSLYNIKGDVSAIVRQGSGSACRSVYGGFVRWLKGGALDGSDSIAECIKPATHWPEMRIIILVTNDKQKDTSSTVGMKTSIDTSELLRYRASVVAPRRCNEMISAIQNKDFEKFATLTMRDSNQFHAVCLDTYPPIFYLSSVSQAIISFVHQYNIVKGSTMVAYSFDAGPNAFLFLLDSHVDEVLGLIIQKFKVHTDSKTVDLLRGIPACPLTDFEAR